MMNMEYEKIVRLMNDKDTLGLDLGSGTFRLSDSSSDGPVAYKLEIIPTKGYRVTYEQSSINVGYDQVPGLDERMRLLACDGIRETSKVQALLIKYAELLRDMNESKTESSKEKSQAEHRPLAITRLATFFRRTMTRRVS